MNDSSAPDAPAVAHPSRVAGVLAAGAVGA